MNWINGFHIVTSIIHCFIPAGEWRKWIDFVTLRSFLQFITQFHSIPLHELIEMRMNEAIHCASLPFVNTHWLRCLHSFDFTYVSSIPFTPPRYIKFHSFQFTFHEFHLITLREDKTIEDILIRHPIHYVPAIMHRDASYSSFTVLVRYWLILYVLAYCYNNMFMLDYVNMAQSPTWILL